ncbi:hypothetical protein VTK73DRAFT_4948 [Phialemonium thermophilum]|uniref:SET domain-containing protein n=1 Tax=Phialemonium thermophilum TaxID=223376 RepID=A0ABR3WR40_9PEZI
MLPSGSAMTWYGALASAVLLLAAGQCRKTGTPPSGESGTQVCVWEPSRILLPPPNRSCPVPIDDVTAEQGESRSSPWSYPPFCVEWEPQDSQLQHAGSIDEGEEEEDQHRSPDAVKYCVYTSTPFRCGHGISLITTPELAASASLGLDDVAVPAATRDHPTSSCSPYYRAFPNSTATPPGSRTQPAFEVTELPGRGLGSVARRRIRKWETVVAGYPAILAQMDFMDVLSPEQIREVMARAVGQLPLEQQQEVFALDRSTGGGMIQDILQTNIFGVTVEGVLHMALVPEASAKGEPRLQAQVGGWFPRRFRSAANRYMGSTFWRYDPHTLTMEIVAMRDINRGEEITFSYAPLGLVYEARKSTLREWGFDCKCPLCSSSRRDLAASDRRRLRVDDLHDALLRGSSLTGRQIEALAEELVRLVEEEAMWPKLAVYYEVIARAYLDAAAALAEKDPGDGGRRRRELLEAAERHVELCEGTWKQYAGGFEHENVEGVAKLWKDLNEAKETAASS